MENIILDIMTLDFSQWSIESFILLLIFLILFAQLCFKLLGVSK